MSYGKKIKDFPKDKYHEINLLSVIYQLWNIEEFSDSLMTIDTNDTKKDGIYQLYKGLAEE